MVINNKLLNEWDLKEDSVRGFVTDQGCAKATGHQFGFFPLY